MHKPGLSYSAKLKIAKWLFTIAVLFFAGKPFIGFTMDRSAPLNEHSILVKSFTKRAQEYVKNSKFDVKTIQKKLADPVNAVFLLFGALLACILPVTADTLTGLTFTTFRRLKLSSAPAACLWLSDHQLLI